MTTPTTPQLPTPQPARPLPPVRQDAEDARRAGDVMRAWMLAGPGPDDGPRYCSRHNTRLLGDFGFCIFCRDEQREAARGDISPTPEAP